MKYAFIDIESTGTDRDLDQIIEFACIITGDDLVPIDSLHMKLKTTLKPDQLSPSAIEKTGMTYDVIMSHPYTQAEGYQMLTEFLSTYVDRYNKKDKLQFVAYNAKFDSDFVRKLFSDMNDNFYGSYFWHPPLCIMEIFAFMVREDRASFPDFKLETLVKAAGIEWDETKAHEALYDILQSIELYKKLL